jgi:hypothetical protein
MNRRPLFRLRDLAGVLQLAARYLLVLAILFGVVGYFIGLLTAPALHPREDVPGWFQPYFIAMTAIIVALGAVLILQVNFAALELSSRSGAVVYLEMTIGLVAAIVGATTLPSNGWYPQLLALSDLGAAAAVIATLVCGIKKLVADARSTGRTWRDAIHRS